MGIVLVNKLRMMAVKETYFVSQKEKIILDQSNLYIKRSYKAITDNRYRPESDLIFTIRFSLMVNIKLQRNK